MLFGRRRFEREEEERQRERERRNTERLLRALEDSLSNEPALRKLRRLPEHGGST